MGRGNKRIGFPVSFKIILLQSNRAIVILFNGGIKDAGTAQESKNPGMKFYEAQAFVKKIEEALQSEMITIADNNRYLQNFDGSTDII